MEQKKSIPFVFIIIAIILGASLYKHFDFQTFRFQKPALDTLYLVTFVASIIFIVRGAMKQKK